MSENKKINLQGKEITIILNKEKEYISLTDMLKTKDGDFFISDWLRNRNTIEYLGIWESVYNPNFNYGEFAIIKSQAGLNSYKLSVKDTLPDEVLMSRIYVFRGQKVMLDRDLAELYGVETRTLKQAVRRNIDRFPDDFMFEMSKEEFENWRSQFVIPDKKVLGAPKVQENLNGGM